MKGEEAKEEKVVHDWTWIQIVPEQHVHDDDHVDDDDDHVDDDDDHVDDVDHVDHDDDHVEALEGNVLSYAQRKTDSPERSFRGQIIITIIFMITEASSYFESL